MKGHRKDEGGGRSMRWKMVERTMKRKRGVAEDEETGLMVESGG